MVKFHKQVFLNKTTNELKVFSYNIPVKKALVEEAGLEDTEVSIKVENGKIIIEKNIDKNNI